MPWSEPGGLPSFDRWRPSAAERSGAHGRARRAGEAGGRRLGTGAVAPASRGNRARVDAEVRVVSAYAGGGGSPKASGTRGCRGPRAASRWAEAVENARDFLVS